ncbi:MAG: hypothetical protein JNK82_23800 [Myxococcaceae bacterium]|nr:hypothetical protein [Myxococcaceae bacterium]
MSFEPQKIAMTAPLTAARGPTLRDRWVALRNRLLSKPGFQRWAARFPLTRFIARSQAASVFDLCAGFVYSQVLAAMVRLSLLELLRQGPQELEVLASVVGLPRAGARRLLDAAVALGLVERASAGRYALGLKGALLAGNPGALKMVEHHALLYRDLEDPVALLRGDRPDTLLRRFWAYRDGDGGGVEGYSRLMADSISLLADDVLEAFPLGRFTRLLDVGGGEGAFLERVASAAPHLGLSLFDLPAVAARAKTHLASVGLWSRVTVYGGDALLGPLPLGADVVSFVRVIHDHDDAAALTLLEAARAALLPGGAVMIAEPLARTAHAEAMGDAYFGFYLLAMGQGRPRTAAELTALLTRAGFIDVEVRQTRRPLLAGLVVAHTPEKRQA